MKAQGPHILYVGLHTHLYVHKLCSRKVHRGVCQGVAGCCSKAWKQTLSPVFLGSPKEVKSGHTRLVTLKNHTQGIKS